MKQKLPWLVAGAVVIGSLGYLGYKSRQISQRLYEQGEVLRDFAMQCQLASPANSDNRYSDVRLFEIRSNLSQTDRPILFVGDSITATSRLPLEICGHQVVNAGIGGATSAVYERLAPWLLGGNRFPLIVVALGTNDSQISSLPSPAIIRSYSSLLDILSGLSNKLVIVGPPPLDMAGTLAKPYFDEVLSATNERSIHEIAKQRNLPFVDLRKSMGKKSIAADGIHLNAIGFKQWSDAVLEPVTRFACQTAESSQSFK